MRKFSEEEIHRMNVLKKIILLRSKIIQIYGLQNVKIEVDDLDRKENGDFLEISFSLKISNIDCDECSFDPQYFTSILHEIYQNLYSACKIYVGPNLQSNLQKNSLRGILLHKVILEHDTIKEVELGIFYDCNQ